jgi:urea carboxylase system permease
MQGQQSSDSADLAQFGYKQELHRTLGSFSSFAAGFSYISILTGMFQLFYFGFAFGGPAFFWTWPLVFFGQMMVCLCFAELAGKYPIAGSVYNWSKQLSSGAVSWMAGWIMMTASIVTVAAVALAWQIILPQISSKFQIIGDGTGSTDFAKNAVLLGTILIVFTTIVNMIGVNLMAKINNVGVAAELIGATLLVILLAVHVTRGPGVVLKTYGTGTGHDWGYAGAFLVAALMSTYVMYGFDTAGSLGEETNNPRKYAPRSLVRALSAAGILGALLILVSLMAVSNPHDPAMSVSGLPFIVKDVLGNTLGDIFLWDVVLAITVCCLAVHTATIRIAFAMARDNNLPFGSAIARVHGTSRTPIVPAIVVGVLAIVILVININQPQIFTVITSIGIIMVYLAYLLVTVPMLQKRLAGEWQPSAEHFSLGQWGLLVNVLAVVYGAGMAFNLAWPRKDIYNFVAPFHWYLQYGAYLYIGIIAGAGGLYYYFVQRHKTGILPEHAAEPALPASVHGGP